MSGEQGRSAAQWFELAARCYVEAHQGCAWCGASHCVFRAARPERLEFACFLCDFFVCHNHHTDRYFSAPGQAPAAAAS